MFGSKMNTEKKNENQKNDRFCKDLFQNGKPKKINTNRKNEHESKAKTEKQSKKKRKNNNTSKINKKNSKT